ncbi:MAG: hypothetical protein ACI89F_000906, partial [Porticoccaceae bacterium]
NSEVKRSIADGSVGPPHARVGHRQALILKPPSGIGWGFFLGCDSKPSKSILLYYLVSP